MTEHLTHSEISQIHGTGTIPASRRGTIAHHLFTECPECLKAMESFPSLDGDLELNPDLLASLVILLIAFSNDRKVGTHLGPELQYFLKERRLALAFIANACEYTAGWKPEEAMASVEAARDEIDRVFPNYTPDTRDAKCFAAVCYAEALADGAEAQAVLDSYEGDVGDLIPPIGARFNEVAASVTMLTVGSLQLVYACWEGADVCVEKSCMPAQRSLHMYRRALLLAGVKHHREAVACLREARNVMSIRSLPLQARMGYHMLGGLTTLKQLGDMRRLVAELEADEEVRAFDPELDAHLHQAKGFVSAQGGDYEAALNEMLLAVQKFEAIDLAEPGLIALDFAIQTLTRLGRNQRIVELRAEHAGMIHAGSEFLVNVLQASWYQTPMEPPAGISSRRGCA